MKSMPVARTYEKYSKREEKVRRKNNTFNV